MNKYQKYTLLKNAIETIFGSKAWYDLKESNNVNTWKKYTVRTLKAVQVSIHETVTICDKEWLSEIDSDIEHGIEIAEITETIDELIAVIAGTLIKVTFLQIGLKPNRPMNKYRKRCVSLRKENWNLSKYRAVVYLQTDKQKEELFLNNQKRKLGYENQEKLLKKFRNSDSELSYSDWCDINA